MMMPSATLCLIIYPKDFDACLQPCVFLCLSLSPSRLQPSGNRYKEKTEKKNEENDLPICYNQHKEKFSMLSRIPISLYYIQWLEILGVLLY